MREREKVREREGGGDHSKGVKVRGQLCEVSGLFPHSSDIQGSNWGGQIDSKCL